MSILSLYLATAPLAAVLTHELHYTFVRAVLWIL